MPTSADEGHLQMRSAKCARRRNDRIPKLRSPAGEACKSIILAHRKLGSRFEPARLRRPRLAPRPAPRPRRKTTQSGTNGRAGERGGTPPPARLLRASTAALPGSPRSSFVPSGEPALSPLYPQLLETEDLSRKTGTPALAQRVLVLREKTLNRQQGPNGAWVGHLPSGTSVRNDARYPLPQ
jgi:hypothetical protein